MSSAQPEKRDYSSQHCHYKNQHWYYTFADVFADSSSDCTETDTGGRRELTVVRLCHWALSAPFRTNRVGKAGASNEVGFNCLRILLSMLAVANDAVSFESLVRAEGPVLVTD